MNSKYIIMALFTALGVAIAWGICNKIYADEVSKQLDKEVRYEEYLDSLISQKYYYIDENHVFHINKNCMAFDFDNVYSYTLRPKLNTLEDIENIMHFMCEYKVCVFCFNDDLILRVIEKTEKRKKEQVGHSDD